METVTKTFCNEHSNAVVEWACLDPQCPRDRGPFCSQCFKKLHSVCRPDLKLHPSRITEVLSVINQDFDDSGFYAALLTTMETVFNDLSFFPKDPQWSNYFYAWTKADFSGYFLNSLFYTVIVVIGVVMIASMAAYAFSRLQFWGKNFLFLLLISTMMIPIPGSFIALYVLLPDYPK